jgi:hypothetical protein
MSNATFDDDEKSPDGHHPSFHTPPPLVLDSVASLMDHAAERTEIESGAANGREFEGDDRYPAGSLVEADVEFRCVDPDSYYLYCRGREGQELELNGDEWEDADAAADETNAARRDDPSPSWLKVLKAGKCQKKQQDEDDESQQAELTTSLLSPSEEDESEDEEEDYAVFLQSLRDDRRRVDDDDYYSSDDDNSIDQEDDENDDGFYEEEKKSLETPFSLHQNHRRRFAPPARPFLTLWNALAQWATPQAASYLEQLTNLSSDSTTLLIRPFEPVPEANTDVAAGRLGGLYAQLRLHVRPALEALRFLDGPSSKREQDDHCIRAAWIRLGDLLRCFSYDLPMPDLDRPHLRALSVVLLHSVLCGQEGLGATDDDNDNTINSNEPRTKAVPEPCAEIGLSPGEYRALTLTLLRLGRDSDDVDSSL